MIQNSCEVPPLSGNDTEQRASSLRKLLNFQSKESEYLDTSIIEFLSSPNIGLFKLEVLDDSDMQGNLGYTCPKGSEIVISRSTYDGACRGNPRDRFTIFHELGHLILHSNKIIALPRNQKIIPAYQQSEWQADYFAGAIMMPKNMIPLNYTIDLLCSKFGMSRKAVEVRLNKLKMPNYK